VANKTVRTRRKSRVYTEDYKLRIVQEADACTERGQLAALLRREGLNRPPLERWRRARAAWVTAQERGIAAGELSSLADQRAAKEAKIQAREVRLLDTMLEELSTIRQRRHPEYLRPPPPEGPWIDTRGKSWKQFPSANVNAQAARVWPPIENAAPGTPSTRAARIAAMAAREGGRGAGPW
jgi:transposase-like protein